MTEWVDKLKTVVLAKPCVVVRFGAREWHALLRSRRGVNEFTVARPHVLLEGVKTPTVCIVFGNGNRDHSAYLGILSSRGAVTTLETRIKIRRAVAVQPSTEDGLRNLDIPKHYARLLKERLATDEQVVRFSPKLSATIVEALASIESNRVGMRVVAEAFSSPKFYGGAAALQEDAVQTALRAFGLSPQDQAHHLELVEGQDTALARVAIMEDSVVEHDARSIPGHALVGSDLTGRAVFERGNETLEVFTANRRSLEHVFGVDLIYLNVTRKNVVMVQYKMLESVRRGETTEMDWVYRPDKQLEEELRRMDRFSVAHPPGEYEYRLNSEIFYLKFVKRDAVLGKSGIVMPVNHFKLLKADPSCHGPRGALRISYETLGGRYLGQTTFLGLIRSGYVGANASTTQSLTTLIRAILKRGKAVVVGVQTATTHRAGGRAADDLDEIDET